MRKIKLINLFIILVVLLNTFSTTVIAQPNDELLDLYKTYFEDTTVVGITSVTSKDGHSTYNIKQKPLDYCNIDIPSDTAIEIDLSTLIDDVDYPSSLYSISCNFKKDWEEENIFITFLTSNHETNRAIAKKIYNILKEKYNIGSAYVCLDSQITSNTQLITWSSFRGTDEFGYPVTTDEQLSKKQIYQLRKAITANNFTDVATVDDDGKVIVNESVSEVEKLKFALWFKEEYGFKVVTRNSDTSYQYNTTEVIHYTELSGDVDNDNIVTYRDIEMLRYYLFYGNIDGYDTRPQVTFNVKNADLTADGVIDVFDLVLLRQLLYDNR